MNHSDVYIPPITEDRWDRRNGITNLPTLHGIVAYSHDCPGEFVEGVLAAASEQWDEVIAELLTRLTGEAA